ncbi:MAG: carbohydrate ABC transporter permease [Firmicutes bacterium]|nr:carbohydrate ABC transporter permease [Bacillota bacterium]
MRSSVGSKSAKYISYLLVFLFLVWISVPLLVVFNQSFKPTLIMFSDPPKWIFKPTLEHYYKVFARQQLHKFMFNSLVVGLSTTVLSLVLGSLAGYSLARIDMKGKEKWAFLILLCKMIPAGALVVPMYYIVRRLGLANTYVGLIVAHTTFSLPFVVWMMRSFFQEIPVELEQAAMVDGCSRLGAFWRITAPLAAPGLTATGILTLLLSWNEFLFALVLSGRNTRTLPIGISAFIGSVSIDWGGSSAAAVVAMVPVFIAGLMVQKYLVRGLTMGAVKG